MCGAKIFYFVYDQRRVWSNGTIKYDNYSRIILSNNKTCLIKKTHLFVHTIANIRNNCFPIKISTLKSGEITRTDEKNRSVYFIQCTRI